MALFSSLKTLLNRLLPRVYMREQAVVLMILLIPLFFADEIRLSEVIVTAAVFVTFKHATVSDRMQEMQAVKAKPDVECYHKSNQYFLIKEALWITFFIMIQSWGALLGAIAFFIYPFWRKYYRKKYPLQVPA